MRVDRNHAGLLVVVLTVVAILVISKRSSATTAECQTTDSGSVGTSAADPTAAGGGGDDSAVSWSTLQPFDGGGGRTIYGHSFADASDDWPTAQGGPIATRYVCSEYESHVVEGAAYLTLPAPQVVSHSDEVITATARDHRRPGRLGCLVPRNRAGNIGPLRLPD